MILAKTRMQIKSYTNAIVGQLLYKSSFDCFKRLLVEKDSLSLFWTCPSLVGVAPEKGIVFDW
jgi:solute carrier family 25 aspartate/glutamate transporter 12/13